ncbi:MAG: T9SS type A sorting domain-containing protein [Bacteroidota bacterium]|nr:T9SS type A sorting domain-containing protein [Bacteroidota bacterium]MDP4212521.1 T9SS type A sorting domain-containing protein [Bacteroidota bacterium]MDP4250521.1 T9SS type A sorting domain-containing protein [Bacteroidota bacterium]
MVTIYPNPASSTLYLSTGNHLITVRSLEVYSINSVLVYAVNAMLPSCYAMNIDDFPQGAYTAILELSDGSRQIKQFVKQ